MGTSANLGPYLRWQYLRGYSKLLAWLLMLGSFAACPSEIEMMDGKNYANKPCQINSLELTFPCLNIAEFHLRDRLEVFRNSYN